MAVFVLLADGLRTDTLRRAFHAGALPALRALRDAGGLHEITTVFPSVTGPAYVPFLLGRFPGPVGMPGLRWFDRSRTTCRFPDYTRSYVGYQMPAVNADLDADAPTIFELAPGSAGAMSMVTRGLPRDGRLMELNLRSAARALVTHFTGDLDDWLRVDEETSAKVIATAATDRPFVFASFMGVDKLSHAREQDHPSVQRALGIIDRTVAALRAPGTSDHAPPRVWVASDHGHSPVHHHDDLARGIATLGHRVVAHPWVIRPGAEVAVMVSGNAMAHVYLELAHRARPFWTALAPRWTELAEWLLHRPSVDMMLLPLDAERCSVWSAERGRATVLRRAGQLSYVRDTGDPLGIGADLRDVCTAAAWDATRATNYPDSVVQIASIAGAARAGDVILSARREWDFRERYEPIPHRSSHGALHRDHMLVPLLLDAPPARHPRRTTDVMASALAALGISRPAALDGDAFL